MKSWTKILPFFIVEWLAKRNLERFNINIKTCNWDKSGVKQIVKPYKGVYLETKGK